MREQSKDLSNTNTSSFQPSDEVNSISDTKPPEEVDIYSDILTDQDEQILKLTQKVGKTSSENALLNKSLSIQQKTYDELRNNYQQLLLKYNTLSTNSSALFKTAQAEVKRKDRMIQELRREIDNLVFRKIPAAQAAGASKRIVADAGNKCKSSFKKTEPVGPGPPYLAAVKSESSEDTNVGVESEVKQKTDKGAVDQKHNSAVSQTSAGPGPPFLSAVKSESSEGTTVGIEPEVKQKKDKGNDDQKSNGVVSPKSNTSPSINTPPLIQGPITEYSRRMYKKIYGVCPLQAESNVNVNSNPDVNIDRSKSCKDKNPSNEETVAIKINQNVNKSPRIALKLQEQVKELIKLGTNSISKLLPKKSPPGKKAEVSPVSTEVKTSEQTQNKSGSTQHLVIYCDGKDNNSPEKDNSSKIDINDTINSILKNQVNDLYSSSKKPVEVSSKFPNYMRDSLNNKNITNSSTKSTVNHVHTGKKVNNVVNLTTDKKSCDLQCQEKKVLQDSKKSKPNRLLANLNKRGLSKSVISPVTFGKLVSPEISSSEKSYNTPINKLDKSQLSPQKASADKLQMSQEIMSLVKSNTSFKTSSISVEEKKHFLTLLFGESPLKSRDVVEVTLKEKYKEENLESPLPNNVAVNPDFLVLPDSLALDSDGPQDLVINSTACSRNTSPHVSESCEKDEDNAKHISYTHNKEPPLHCVIKKPNICSTTSSIENNLGDITKTEGQNTVASPSKAIDTSNNLDLNGANKMNTSLASNTHQNLLKDNSCLPNLSVCFSLESKSQPEINPKCSMESKEKDLLKLAAVSQSLNLPNETNTEFNGYLSHSSSSEVNSGNNSSTYKTGEGPSSNVIRFVPSPSQLSLVSALKHSENSVFNIAEDTAEFVSALTRVRDISPIRTPDKNNKPLTEAGLQLKIAEVNEESQDSGKSFVLSSPDKVMLIPVLSLQNEPAESLSQSVESQSAIHDKNQFSNVQNSFFGNLKNAKFTWNELESCKFENLKPSSIEKTNDHRIATENKPSESSTLNETTNIFKRTRPVRRVEILNQTKRETSVMYSKENKSFEISQSSVFIGSTESKPLVGVQYACTENKHGHDLCKQSVFSNVEEKCQEENKLTLQPLLKTGATNQTELLVQLPNVMKVSPIELCNDGINKNQDLAVESLSKKHIIISPGHCEKKTFKRSASLKTMPKPLPKIHFDILGRSEDKEDFLKQNHTRNNELIDKYNSNERLKNDEEKISLKPKLSYEIDKVKVSRILRSDINHQKYNKPTILLENLSVCKSNDQKTRANKELDQSPHIANINKKTRVSSFQRRPIQNSVELVKESTNMMKSMGTPCLKEQNVIKSTTISVSETSSMLSCKISKEVSNKLEYPRKNQQNPVENFKIINPFLNICKRSEKEITKEPIRNCKIKENKNTEQTLQSTSLSQPCKFQSKSPNPEEKRTFESCSKGLNENQHTKTTQSDLTDREKKNDLKKNIETSHSNILKTRSTSFDINCRDPLITSNHRRSHSNCSEGKIHQSLRGSNSSSPEARSSSKYVEKPDRTESKSPQPRLRSKSSLQPTKLQGKSPETRRNKSQHKKQYLADGPFHKNDDIHRRSSFSRIPDPKLRGHHVQGRSRSRSRDSGYPLKSDHSSRSRNNSSYKIDSPKHYLKRSRSKSPHLYDRYKKSRGTNKFYYKHLSERSSYLSRKRKSRSLSTESLNKYNKFKKSKQSHGNSTHHPHAQSPNTIKARDHKMQTNQEKENPSNNQEPLIRLEELEKKFGFITNQVNNKVNETYDKINRNPKAFSFLDEVNEMKKEMINLKNQLKKVQSPSKDIVFKAKADLEICQENTTDQIDVAKPVPRSCLIKGDKWGTSRSTDDSGSSPHLNERISVQKEPQNDPAVLPKTLPVQSKPIQIIKYVKRRSRNLGDSDVTVVSSSTKSSTSLGSISKPECTKYS